MNDLGSHFTSVEVSLQEGFPNDAKFRYLPNILRVLAHRPQKGHIFLKFQ